MYKVKIWEKELRCQICGNDKWHSKTLKVVDYENYLLDKNYEEVRYLYECDKCGYGMWFGMITDWENDRNNIELIKVDDSDDM